MPDLGATGCGPFFMRWTESGPIDAPPVLLLHGLSAGAHSYEWRALVPLEVVPGAGAGSARPRGERSAGPRVHPGRSAAVVDALIRDAGPDSAAVASSLTGAYALRSVVAGAPVRWLTLITPTGLGRPREEPDRVVEVISQLDRER